MKTQRHSHKRPVLAAAVQIGISAAALIWLPSVSAQDLMLEEVVVTAQKRAESLQDVPIAVTAFSGEKILEAGIFGMEDLTSYVPNVTMFSSPGGGSPGRIFIRGIGSGNLASFEQSVGSFIDGVYAGRTRQYLIPFVDIGSVEVLRGPQGALLGKNTVAGAMIINSARPTDTFEALLRGDYEFEYNSTEYQGMISGPLTDTVRGRLVAETQNTEGYMDNIIRGSDEPQIDASIIRGSLVAEPVDSLSIYAKVEYMDQKTTGTSNQLTSTDGSFRGLIQHTDVLSPLEDGKFDDKNTLNSWNEEGTKTDTLNSVIQLDWDLDEATLTSVTGYSDYDSDFRLDGDTSDINFIERSTSEKFDQISQEFRLSSPGGEVFDYIAGIYLESHDLDIEVPTNISLTALSAQNVPGSPVPPVDLAYVRRYHQDSDTAAVFGQLTWRFVENWSITGGARYFYEKKKGSLNSIAADFGETTPTEDPTVEAIVSTLLNQVPGSIEDDRDTDKVPYSVNLAWDYNDDGMAYLRYAVGYKSGGFNDTLSDLDPEAFEFSDEKVKSVELGTKMTLLDGAANLNFAAFYTEMSDLQVSSFVDSAFIVGNAAESTSQGFELEGRWIAMPSLNFSATLGYLDSKYDDFPGAPCTASQLASDDPVAAGCAGWLASNPAAGTTNLKGETAGRSPEWTGSVTANVFYPLGDAIDFKGSIDFLYEDELNEKLDPNYQDSYYKINARLALASSDDTWEVALIGRNLTDETTMGNGFGVAFFSGSWAKNRQPPRTVTLEALYRFH
jgi:outer membrane receptor protein involved in Fe transport